MEEVVRRELGLVRERVDEGEPRLRPLGHADGDGAVQLHDGRGEHLREPRVERGDTRPVGGGGLAGARVAGGDRGLEGVGAVRPAERLRPREGREAAGDLGSVPEATVLLEEQHRRAAGVLARRRARRVELHERDEPVHLGLGRRELREHAPEAEGLLAELATHPAPAGGRGVALVEDEVDDLEHRGEALRQLGAAGHLEGDAPLRERPLRPHDPLRDGGLRDEERAGDLVRLEAAEQTQRERDARLRREHRVAGREHEPEQVVAHVVVDRRLDVRRAPLGVVQVAAELGVLARQHLRAPRVVERAVLRRGHEPSPGPLRHALRRPALQRRHERVLGELLGDADVAHDAGEPRDEARRLLPEDGGDGALRIVHARD